LSDSVEKLECKIIDGKLLITKDFLCFDSDCTELHLQLQRTDAKEEVYTALDDFSKIAFKDVEIHWGSNGIAHAMEESMYFTLIGMLPDGNHTITTKLFRTPAEFRDGFGKANRSGRVTGLTGITEDTPFLGSHAFIERIKGQVKFLELKFTAESPRKYNRLLNFMKEVAPKRVKIMIEGKAYLKYNEILSHLNWATLEEIRFGDDEGKLKESDLEKINVYNCTNGLVIDRTTGVLRNLMIRALRSMTISEYVKINENKYDSELARAVGKTGVESLILEFTVERDYDFDESTTGSVKDEDQEQALLNSAEIMLNSPTVKTLVLLSWEMDEYLERTVECIEELLSKLRRSRLSKLVAVSKYSVSLQVENYWRRRR